jgi:glutathione peroxidase
MTDIYTKYSEYGLEILAFPCNQFLNQEPYDDAWIENFARGKYGAKYPMFHKIDVNGDNAHDVFRFVRRHSSLYNNQTGVVGDISWNFGKFLVGQDGQVISYHLPNADLAAITVEIEGILGVKKNNDGTAVPFLQ